MDYKIVGAFLEEIRNCHESFRTTRSYEIATKGREVVD